MRSHLGHQTTLRAWILLLSSILFVFLAHPAVAAPVQVMTVVPEAGFPIMDPPLQAMLEGQGYVFSSTLPSTEITPALLTGVGILFFQETPLANDPLTAAEADVVETFVRGGGGVLIVGEAGPDFGPSNLASRAAPFGVGVLTVGIFETITDFTPHPVTAGFTSLTIFGGDSLTVSPPAIPIGRLANGDSILAVAELDRGRVVVVGDEVWRSRDFGNPTFTSNVFNWLGPTSTVPEPPTLALVVPGIVALVIWASRRRRWI